jgi:hypothetical protein
MIRGLLPALLVLAGCGHKGVREEERGSASGVPLPERSVPLRRPTVRYRMVPQVPMKENCRVLRVEADGAETQLDLQPCPRDLHPGERIRLVGRTCYRDGVPERSGPVVCPHSLPDWETKDLRAQYPDAGL